METEKKKITGKKEKEKRLWIYFMIRDTITRRKMWIVFHDRE